ncbi:DMT family transporter [Haliscomenobacter sp.]|uniref:DMT family transporter n=1 Tax=Haliscomenobacter sp. TaxID=2717303 RepID=UPI0035946EE9
MSTAPALSNNFSQRRRIIASILVLIAALCFSAKAVLVKLAYRYEIDSISLLTLRMVFSLPFFLGIAIWAKQKALRENRHVVLSTRDWIAIFLFGLCGYYLASMLDFMGLFYITAGLERLILFLYPTMVLAINAIFLKKPVTRIQWIALALTYGGVSLAFLDRDQLGVGSNVFLGSILIFFSGLTYAIYLVGSGQYITKVGSLRYTCLAMLAASVGVIVQHGIIYQWALFNFPSQVYVLSIIMAILSTVLPTFMMSEAIRIIGSSNVAIIGSVGPVATIVMGYFLLGETFGLWQFLGTVLVIIGVLRISLK